MFGEYKFFSEVEEKFPDFDSLYPDLSVEADKDVPSLSGLEPDTSSDTSSGGGSIIYASLEVMGVIAMQPYGIQIGSGGGGNSSNMKWNDEDKKRKQHYGITGKGRSR